MIITLVPLVASWQVIVVVVAVGLHLPSWSLPQGEPGNGRVVVVVVVVVSGNSH